jgi:7-carboxy-7-deazaguanine synthase (Cx14CxxC type)
VVSFLVKEIFYSIQGEGEYAGKPAVFCRFAGCNLWSGREADRGSAVCRFCDTDFLGGTRYATPAELADAIGAAWPGTSARPFVVLTGGEPALQVTWHLVCLLRDRGFYIAIETNGTRKLPPAIDHVTVSPKAGAELAVRVADALKLVYPQPGLDPATFEAMDFGRLYLQPMDGPDAEANTRAAVAYCLAHPRWRLSLQIHKLLGLR